MAKSRKQAKPRKQVGRHAGIGHNQSPVSPEALVAEMATLQAAEEKTDANISLVPQLVDYIYEIRFYPEGPLTEGELAAFDIKHAERQLHVILGVTRLPVETLIVEKHIAEEEQKAQNAARSRRLLEILTTHHHWLQGSMDGERADLANENLDDINLAGRDLSHVSFANARLCGANLRSAKLVGADFTGADLSGADLTGCDLSGASLADANLIGANLTSTNLKGADVWRANLARCVISPQALHALLGCEQPGDTKKK